MKRLLIAVLACLAGVGGTAYAAPANTPPEVVAAAQKVADQWLRDWNNNASNTPATKSRVRWCRVNLYRTEAPELWTCRLRLALSDGGHCSGRTRVERFGDGTASPGPYKIRRCVS